MDHLKANDHIICDVTSHDLWVKFKLTIDAPEKSLESELEIKVGGTQHIAKAVSPDLELLLSRHLESKGTYLCHD